MNASGSADRNVPANVPIAAAFGFGDKQSIRLAECFVTEGIRLFRCDQLAAAIEQFDCTHAICRDLPDSFGAGLTVQALALKSAALVKLGRFSAAVECQEAAVSTCQQSPTGVWREAVIGGSPILVMNRAWTLLHFGREAEGLRSLERCLKQQVATTSLNTERIGRGRVLFTLGKSYMQAQQLIAALAPFDEAQVLFHESTRSESSSSETDLAVVLAAKAETLLKLGRTAEARRVNKAAVQLLLELTDGKAQVGLVGELAAALAVQKLIQKRSLNSKPSRTPGI